MIDQAAGRISEELQRVLDRLPWPNVRGKRCLDLGTGGWWLASELERRGAAEVVVINVKDEGDLRDLDPEAVGTFDIVVSDGLLWRVRDPLGALKAVHGVTNGMFLSAEPMDLWTSVLGRGRPLFTIRDDGGGIQGFSFNGAGHKQLLDAAGFTVERVSKPFVVPGDATRDALEPPWLERLTTLATRVVTRSSGPGRLHRALLARS